MKIDTRKYPPATSECVSPPDWSPPSSATTMRLASESDPSTYARNIFRNVKSLHSPGYAKWVLHGGMAGTSKIRDPEDPGYRSLGILAAWPANPAAHESIPLQCWASSSELDAPPPRALPRPPTPGGYILPLQGPAELDSTVSGPSLRSRWSAVRQCRPCLQPLRQTHNACKSWPPAHTCKEQDLGGYLCLFPLLMKIWAWVGSQQEQHAYSILL